MEHESVSLFANPETWVAVAFVMFMGVVLYFRVHKTIAESLDKRSAQIAAEIDQARRLRAEAEEALALYRKKAAEAEGEAAAIIAQAEAEAKAMAAEGQAALEASIARRVEAAKSKIAQAEAKAMDEVRAEAVRVATLAAERLIVEQMDAAKSAALIDRTIASLDSTLH